MRHNIMHKNILYIPMIFWAWVICDVTLAGVPIGKPNRMNNYSFHNEQAYITEKTGSADYNILYIDFKNKVTRVLAKGNIGDFAISKDKTLLAYVKDHGEIVIVINIADGEKLYKNGRASQDFLQWSETGNQLTFFDERKEKLYVINFDANVIEKFAKAKGDIISVKWEKSCRCFDYQFIPSEDSGRSALYGVFRFIEDRLVKSEKKSLLVSPDGKYYLVPRSEYETGNFLYVYDYKTDKLLRQYDSGEFLMGRTSVIWKNDIVRMLGYPSGSINVDTGKIISSRNGYLLAYGEINPRPERTFTDLASDKKDYVLMWDRKKEVFKVEDISTGKIIKTYKKFW